MYAISFLRYKWWRKWKLVRHAWNECRDTVGLGLAPYIELECRKRLNILKLLKMIVSITYKIEWSLPKRIDTVDSIEFCLVTSNLNRYEKDKRLQVSPAAPVNRDYCNLSVLSSRVFQRRENLLHEKQHDGGKPVLQKALLSAHVYSMGNYRPCVQNRVCCYPWI